MPRDGSNVYSKPAGTAAVSGQPIDSADYNSTVDDLVTDANTARPIVAGGTGATTASGARANLGAQAQGAVLDDLNTLGAAGAAAKVIASDGAGSFAYKDLAGTVSQSGGTPTGAVFERGSNSNGQYVRFADGTQICWRNVDLNYFTSSQVRSVWTFPAAFVDNAYRVAASASASSVFFDATPGNDEVGAPQPDDFNASSVRLSVYKNSGATSFVSGDLISAHVQAVGRWF